MQETKQAPKFRGQVLNRVYRIWLFRRFLPVLLGEIIVFSLVLYWIGKEVFVQKVLENVIRISLNRPSGFFSFSLSTFEHTETITKLLVVLLVVLIALLIRSVTQGILRLILVKKNYFGRINSQ